MMSAEYPHERQSPTVIVDKLCSDYPRVYVPTSSFLTKCYKKEFQDSLLGAIPGPPGCPPGCLPIVMPPGGQSKYV